MRIYVGNEKNNKLRKMTRMPEINECFGIFISKILGIKAYNEESNLFDEFNKGIEYSAGGVVQAEEDYALIFKYLGDNRCQELLTSKIINLDSSENDFEMTSIQEIDTPTKLFQKVKYLSKNPLIIVQNIEDDTPLLKLNEEFMNFYLNNKDKKAIIKETLDKAEKQAKEELLDSFKKLVEKDHENAIEINKTYSLK